ncbi:hypothetical protein [Rothia uropygialis]|uniref:hypothetical protein n=1 Tax=Kocuria sp. 36 TaxID=1415402 RepID=UPI0013EB7B74|nr:hypothetical protein [Kocuria sp. 36]
MSQRRIALFATVSAWVAVVLALGLTLLAGGPMFILLAFTAVIALSVTFYWSMRSRQQS